MATSAAEELREFCQTPGSASQFFPFGSQGYKDSVRHWLQSSSDVAEAAVQPGNAEDLSEIIKILGKWRAPFAVKGGGHATSPNLSSTRGVQIYMNRFENVRYLRRPDKRLEVGAGCLWDRVYREVVPLGRNVIGGAASEGVGVAGWCLGGGYSLKSNNYGIGIDSILGFEVVLPDGRIVNANQNENSDLFAALKGGGNNFGIVTKFILKTYPQRKTYGARITFQKPEFEQAEAAIADFAEKETKRRAAIVAAFRHTLIPGKTEPESVINLLCIYDGKKRTYDPFKRFQSIKGDPYQPDAAGWGVRAAAAPVQPMSFVQRAVKVSNADDSDNDTDDDGGSSEISASAAAAGFREMDYFEADQLSGSRFDPPEWQKQPSPALNMSMFAQVRTAQPMMMAAAAPMPTPQKSSMSGVGEVKGCGRFGCIMVSGYTKKLVKAVSEQSRISASKMANNGGRMVIIDVWPFLPRLFETSTPSAWPHPRGKVWFPCLAYFLWEEEKDTKFWLDEMARAFAKIKEVAKKEGCHEDSFPAYCNVSLDTTTPEEIYRDNLPWLMDLRAKYDPDDVMGLCSGFKIPHPGGRAKPDVDRDAILQWVGPNDPLYSDAVSYFGSRWVNPEKRFPRIHAIYRVVLRNSRAKNHEKRYEAYKSQLSRRLKQSAEEDLFHGVRRACNIGDDNVVTPCSSPECKVCRILECDFASSAAHKKGYWGWGIYTTTASNKADYFSENVNITSQYKVVLWSKVVTGKPKIMQNKQNLTRAPDGFDSVKALTSSEGGVVQYSERVVYRDDAMCPWVVIVYSR